MNDSTREEYYKRTIEDLIRLWQVAIAKQLVLQTWLAQHHQPSEWREEVAELEQAGLPQQMLITEKLCELLLNQQQIDLNADWSEIVRRTLNS